jgi:hypothetical protein
MNTGRLSALSLNVLSVIALAVVAWNFFHKAPAGSNSMKELAVGSKPKVSGVSWNSSPRTVLLGISTTCPFCRASAPFYRDLVAGQGDKYRVVALLPEPVAKAQPSLPELGIESLRTIQQANYQTLGIAVTPELFIVDSHGVVEAAWKGRVNPGQEAEIFSQLGAARPAPALGAPVESVQDLYIAPDHAAAALADPNVVLIDSRNRDSYDAAHIRGALEMPSSEMSDRAIHELPKDKPLIAYCGVDQRSGCNVTGLMSGTTTRCDVVQQVLAAHGFQNLRLLSPELPVLAAQGVAVRGTMCR